MTDLAEKPASLDLSGTGMARVIRFAAGVGLAVVVTIVLFWAMRALIATGDDTLAPSEPGVTIDFVRVEREPDPVRQERLRPPPALNPPPEIQTTNNFDSVTTTVVTVPGPVAPPAKVIQFDPRGFNLVDGDVMTLMAVSPGFPQRAKERGIEGYCTVQFTVTAAGAVRDAVVVPGACTHSVFHRVSVNAALQTKFKPRVIDGQPVEVTGWKMRYKFELRD